MVASTIEAYGVVVVHKTQTQIENTPFSSSAVDLSHLNIDQLRKASAFVHPAEYAVEDGE